MRICIAFVCGAVVFCAACSRTPPPPPVPSAGESLKELVSVYRYIEYSKLPLPRKTEDFADYVDSLPSAYERIKQGECVVIWGAGRAAGEAGKQILAYEKKAAAEGGAVLLRDGTVKVLTAEEFNAAPKAR